MPPFSGPGGIAPTGPASAPPEWTGFPTEGAIDPGDLRTEETLEDEDLPWLSSDNAAEVLAEPEEERTGEETEDLPPWLSWIEPEGATAGQERGPTADLRAGESEPGFLRSDSITEGAETPGAATEEALPSSLTGDEPAYGAEPEPRGVPASSDPHATVDGESPLDGSLLEIAERLEALARGLRERPQELLEGRDGADPLELLITGYAIGYLHRGSRR